MWIRIRLKLSLQCLESASVASVIIISWCEWRELFLVVLVFTEKLYFHLSA